MDLKSSSNQSGFHKSASSSGFDVVQTEAKSRKARTVKGAESSQISNERSDPRSSSGRLLGLSKIMSMPSLSMCRTSDALSPEQLGEHSSGRTRRESQDSSQRSERSVDSGSGSGRKRSKRPSHQPEDTSSSQKDGVDPSVSLGQERPDESSSTTFPQIEKIQPNQKNADSWFSGSRRKSRSYWENQAKELMSQFEQAHQEKETLAHEKDRLESQNKDLKGQLTQAQGKDVLMAILLSRFEQAGQENQILKKQIDTVSQQQRELEHHLNQSLREKDLLQQQDKQNLHNIDNLHKEIEEVKLQRLEDEWRSEIEKTIFQTALKAQLSETQEYLTQARNHDQQEINNLRGQVERANHDKENLTRANQDLTSQVERANYDKELLEHRLNRARERYFHLESQLAQARERCSHLERQSRQNQQGIERLNKEKEHLELQLAQAHNHNSDLQQQQQQNQQGIERLNKEKEHLELQLAQAHNHNSDLQQQQQQKQQDIEHLNKEKEHLELQLAQAHNHNSDLQRQFEQKQRDIEHLNQKIEKLQSQLTKAHQDINQLTQQKEALLFVLQNRLERAEQEKANLNRQIKALDHQLDQQFQEFIRQFDIKWSTARAAYDKSYRNEERKYKKYHKKELSNEDTRFIERCQEIIEEIRMKYEIEKEASSNNIEKDEKQEEDKSKEKRNEEFKKLKEKFSDHHSEEYKSSMREVLQKFLDEQKQIEQKFASQRAEKMQELARKSRTEIDKQIEILKEEHQAKIEELEKEYNERLESSRKIWDEGRIKLKQDIREECQQEFSRDIQIWEKNYHALEMLLKQAQRERDYLTQKLTILEQSSKYLPHVQSEDDIDAYLKRHLSDQQEITPKMRRSLSAMVSLDKFYHGEKTQDDMLPLSYPPYEANSRSKDNADDSSTSYSQKTAADGDHSSRKAEFIPRAFSRHLRNASFDTSSSSSKQSLVRHDELKKSLTSPLPLYQMGGSNDATDDPNNASSSTTNDANNALVPHDGQLPQINWPQPISIDQIGITLSSVPRSNRDVTTPVPEHQETQRITSRLRDGNRSEKKLGITDVVLDKKNWQESTLSNIQNAVDIPNAITQRNNQEDIATLNQIYENCEKIKMQSYEIAESRILIKSLQKALNIKMESEDDVKAYLSNKSPDEAQSFIEKIREIKSSDDFKTKVEAEKENIITTAELLRNDSVQIVKNNANTRNTATAEQLKRLIADYNAGTGAWAALNRVTPGNVAVNPYFPIYLP